MSALTMPSLMHESQTKASRENICPRCSDIQMEVSAGSGVRCADPVQGDRGCVVSESVLDLPSQPAG